jgi:hypothetical protein
MLVLADFNNVGPSAVTDGDAVIQDGLERVADLVRRVLAPRTPSRSRDALDVDVRLYDGWLDKNGALLEKSRITTRLLPACLDGLQDGVRISATIVTSLACRPDAILRGTYINREQKMVDQMLAQDLHYFASLDIYGAICVIASDEDYVPALLATASRYQTPITWLRSRELGRNDDYLTAASVTTIYDAAWSR